MTTPETTAPAPGRTIARLLADALVATGVEIAFTVPGESFLPLLDALETRGIRVVAARHEGGAAFMAEAWGQLTGRPAAVLGTRAVGAANMAIGVVTARADSTPMVAIVGQVHRDRLGREAFQEADVAGSIGRLAKWAVEVRDVEIAPGAIEEALHRAVDGRPGPVMIVVPEDVLVETTADMRFAGSTRPPERRAPEPPLPRVSAALRMLAAAERPVIVAGAGVLRSRGTRDLVRLAETLEIPVIASWRRGDAFPNDHRLYLGMSGFGAPETVRQRLVEADALLVLGSRLNEVTTFGYAVPAPGARWAHVDREPRAADEDGTGGRPAISITADADSFLRAALRAVTGAVHDKAVYDARRERNATDRAAFLAASIVTDGDAGTTGVHPGRAVAALQATLPPTALITTDAGNFAGWIARGFRFRRPGTFLGPTSGAMGYALPAAIAAAVQAPDRAAVAVAGDGGFAMTMAELETAVRLHLPVVAIVFDDRRYGMIQDHQVQGGHGTVATDLGAVDFAAAARALGARGITVERDADVAAAFTDAVRSGEPTVVHLILDRSWIAVGRRGVAPEPGVAAAPEGAPAPGAAPEPEALPEPTPAAPESGAAPEPTVPAAPEPEMAPESEAVAEPAAPELEPAPEPARVESVEDSTAAAPDTAAETGAAAAEPIVGEAGPASTRTSDGEPAGPEDAETAIAPDAGA